MRKPIVVLLGAALISTVIPGSINLAQQASFGPNQSQCENLKTLSLQNTSVTTAEFIAAGPFQPSGTPQPQAVVLPPHCRVAVVLQPSKDSHIEVEIWLPTEDWNGKFEAVGNGGWAGVITFGSGNPPPIPRSLVYALKEGYATASTDTGHVNDGNGAAFSVGHPEKLTDFAYRAVHEMILRSKEIITAFYGNRPRYSYWNGCSTGGRQGLIEAQRFPEDFDGIVAGAPANYWTHLMVGIISAAQATHKDRPGNMTTEKLSLLHDAVVRSCDAIDGIKDGILEDPRSCKFDLKQLECKTGENVPCLTAAEVAAARKMYDGAVNPRTGAPVYPGMAFGSELGWDPINGLQPFAIAESHFRHVIFKDDRNWDYRNLNFDEDVALTDKTDNGLINAIDSNLQPFFARGGKLLQYHGWNDQQISPFNSINYYNSVEQRLGRDKLANSYRLFMAPGMMHCGFGDGPNQFNPMSALERWRESNLAPDQIVASHVTNGVVDMTRPLCPYPQIATYMGKGSTRDAANFICKAPAKR